METENLPQEESQFITVEGKQIEVPKKLQVTSDEQLRNSLDILGMLEKWPLNHSEKTQALIILYPLFACHYIQPILYGGNYDPEEAQNLWFRLKENKTDESLTELGQNFCIEVMRELSRRLIKLSINQN